MIRAVLFDLDGTLLDRDRSLEAFLDNQYDRLEAFRHIPKEPFKLRFVELDARGCVWKDRVYRTLIEEFGAEGRANAEELLADYVNSFRFHCRPFPGTIELLEGLKRRGFKLALVTNGYTDFQESNISALNLNPFFDEILISEREGVRKPDPEIFLRALHRLGVSPEEAVFVGDHPENDIDGAAKAGLRTIWKEDSGCAKPKNATGSVSRLSEIPFLLEGWSIE
ncbi:HAD family hydrolase [Cohnella xylanilytica]|uniref:HAD family hydrolase n=1 Tax=Cohnella xylanilytica TaxID=557555 RepID=A0A841UAT8_9BACL|nr:HAD family hydrolase [Cohnella xylanilytica]MBB6695081.1 HAD family hydrolase [Cohnella xylanilytica]